MSEKIASTKLSQAIITDGVDLVDKFLDSGGPGYGMAIMILVGYGFVLLRQEGMHKQEQELLIRAHTENTEHFKEVMRETLQMIERITEKRTE